MRSPGGFTSFLPSLPPRTILDNKNLAELPKLSDSFYEEMLHDQWMNGKLSNEELESLLHRTSSMNTVPSSKLDALRSKLEDKLFGDSLSSGSNGVTVPDGFSSASDDLISNELDVNKGAYSEYLQDFIEAWNEANTVSKENWQLAADWNEEMYNTRYQRTVEDLKRAGVNPLLISSALSSQYSPTVGSPSSISPTLPSVPYSTTGSSEISGLFNLYSTLIKADTDTQISIIQDLTNNRSISQREAEMWIEGIGGLLESVIGVFSLSGTKRYK